MSNKQKSLRQLAKELGVSHSYLSQIKNGNRPASYKVVSKIRKNSLKSGKQNQQPNLAAYVAACYNPEKLGISLAVGQRILDP